jgi:hypothetical protein
MLANMRATGHSSDEANAAMVQLFLSCPAVNPDETETKVNVDEFEHTEVEQQARRDQQRLLMALARRNQQPVPMADFEHFGLQGPVGCASRALRMKVADFCVATSAVTDSVTPRALSNRPRDASTDVTRRSREKAMTSPRPHSSHH